MSWELRIPKRVRKIVKRFPKSDAPRIAAALREMGDNPWQGDVAKMAGEENIWRRRVGDYRIFYSPQAEHRIVEVKAIVRRASKTY